MPKVMHDIDIKLLKIFHTVAKQQSFSLAAEYLNTSLSNISMNMAQLESRLQMRLCERGVKGFKLTDQGQRVLDASDELNQAIHKFQVQVELAADNMQKEFRIGVLSETIAEGKMYISEILADLEENLPGSFFHLEFRQSLKLKDKVESGELLCAIGYFNNLPSSYQSRYLYSEIHNCYCGSKHELFNVPYEDIDNKVLKKYRIAGYDDMWDDEKQLVPLFTKHDSCSRTSEGILALILTGNYVGLLPSSFARHWVDAGLIRVIVGEKLELGVDIRLIYKSDRAEEPALKTLLDSVKKFYPALRNDSV